MNWPRISLLNLLLITALISMGFALFVAMRTNQKIADENKQIKYELGYIEVKDPSKIYIRQLRHYGDNSWKYRVQWPENYRGRFMVGKTVLRADERPDLENVRFQNGTFVSHSVGGNVGQHEVVFSFVKIGKQWQFSEIATPCPPPPPFEITYVWSKLPTERNSFGTYFDESVADVFLLQRSENGTPDFPPIDELRKARHGKIVEFDANDSIVFFQSINLVQAMQNQFKTDSPIEVFVIALVPDPEKAPKCP